MSFKDIFNITTLDDLYLPLFDNVEDILTEALLKTVFVKHRGVEVNLTVHEEIIERLDSSPLLDEYLADFENVKVAYEELLESVDYKEHMRITDSFVTGFRKHVQQD